MPPDGTSLFVDYVTDTKDAYVDLTKYLEGRGYTRVGQNLMDADMVSAQFRKSGAKEEIDTTTVRDKGRWHTAFTIAQMP